MKDFVYCAPTQVVFGKNAEEKTGGLLSRYGVKKVLIHYGGESARKSGLLDRVCQSVAAEKIEYVLLGGVKPNPRVELVREGVALCKKEGVDFILAVGGGSVIDSAKAIGYGVRHDFDVWDIYEGKAQAADCCPIGVVLTIAAAGSEMSNSSVINNDETGMKRGYTSEYCRPKFAVMNPELTYTLPPYQTASGATDIIMHILERYFYGADFGGSDLADGMSESVIRTVMKHVKEALKDPCDYQSHAEIMWASSIAHNDLLHTGNGTRGDWACHQLEHELGAMFDVAHGAGLGSVWGSWARYVYKNAPQRFYQFATRVMGIAEGEEESVILKGIEAFESFLREIGMPANIRELGLELTDAQIDELAYNCTYRGKRKVGSVMALEEKELREIYTAARG